MKKFFLATAVTFLLLACDKESEKDKQYKSPVQNVYGGQGWSVARVSKEGIPQEVSLVLTNEVFNTAPAGKQGEGHMPGNDFVIPLNQKGTTFTPFQFIMLNWNPNGHEPAGIYDVPHFDIHFYITPANEVLNYLDTIKLNAEPSNGYIPENHLSGPGVPMMGKHFIDLTTPELNGQPFTQTFLYGSYNGALVFLEPMISMNFLKTVSVFERPIPVPSKFETAGYYPTRLMVVKHDGVTEILLKGFVYRQAS